MKFLFIANTDGALYVFRKPIIDKLLSLGHKVLTISSESHYFSSLKSIGVHPIAVKFSRHSISILNNLILFTSIYRIIKKERPHIVHNFTHKAAIYGTLAAWLSGVPKIFITITGLGLLFTYDDIKTKILRYLLLVLYKFAFIFTDSVFFQNPDDMKYFVSNHIINSKKTILTYGSGIDLQKYPKPSLAEKKNARSRLSRELKTDISKRIIVLLPARAVPEKGFFEYYRASKIIHSLKPDKYIFLHLGLVDKDSHFHISEHNINKYADLFAVKYLGYKDNIVEYIQASDIVCLPSYREGLPRSLIEALALGKVIITTDSPGCRETVIHCWNGFLCAPRDSYSLAKMILAVDNEMINNAIIRSRKYCITKYDANLLVNLSIGYYLNNTSLNVQ
jgi:N,N'-diacetylbacillosaminyl-diphospho-undecaprenol alpha-1,3-N-acetylgalactosaminyltransferase